ncbi:MAG: hypothetical protein PVSMB7_28040 [Chloroflexota bacterium]
MPECSASSENLSRREFLERTTATGVALVGSGVFGVGLGQEQTPASGQSSGWPGVLTQHNDIARTGANLYETVLTSHALQSGQFRRLCTRSVDGDIYAQALYVTNVAIRGKGRYNALYVATMANSIYAFDADDVSPGQSGKALLHRRLPHPPYRIPAHPDHRGYSNFESGTSVGVLSTPVVEPRRNLIYLVAMSRRPEDGVDFWLHALDLGTLRTAVGPVRIQAGVHGTGPGSKNGTLYFLPRYHLQRPALLLANDTIYVAFGSYGDTGYYHGWVLAYEASTLRHRAAFNTTPYAGQGGIWQSGQGLASDVAGNVYALSGNSVRTFVAENVRCKPQDQPHRGYPTASQPRPGRDLGNSVIKLSPNLVLLDWFTPSTFAHDNDCDMDLGSGGPLVLPGTHRLVGGGKQGMLYVLDTTGPDTMGGFESATRGGLQAFRAVGTLEYGFPNWSAVCGFEPGRRHHIHGSPVYWDVGKNAYVYVWSENDWLRAFQFSKSAGLFVDDSGLPLNAEHASPWRLSAEDVTTCASTRDPVTGRTRAAMPGAALSLSANGTQLDSGILWATHPAHKDATYSDVPGRLRAFDASSLHLLWDSEHEPVPLGKFAKFCPVTVANGRVYVPTASGYIAFYGIR